MGNFPSTLNVQRRILTVSYQMSRYLLRNIPGELRQDHYTMVLTYWRPWRCDNHFKSVIFEHMLRIMSISCENVLKWMPQNTFDDNSTLVQVMIWYREATKHYMSQCWPRSMLLCDITRPHRVDYARWTGPSFSQKNAPFTCTVSVSRNNITYKDIYIYIY